METFGKSSGLCTKEIKSITDVSGTESFKCKYPIIPGCYVNKHKTISGSPNSHAIAEANVYVDFVEVAILCLINGFSKRGLLNCGVGTK